jgi:hypothetical protein
MPTTHPLARLLGSAPIALLSALLLSACASNGKDMAKVRAPDIAPRDVANAATQPVRDLNIGNEEPGDYLVSVVADPYGNPPMACSGLNGEIDRLDMILGQDIDSPQKPDDDMLGALTIAAVRNVTRLPFRGVIREVTGAAPRERAMRQALLAGAVRRGFLKGRRAALDCPTGAPAALALAPRARAVDDN